MDIMSKLRYSNQQLVQEDSFTINSGNIAADGSAKEFDIGGFANYAQLKQVHITQLTEGTPALADYTFEIWEKDGDGYDPADTSKRYLRIFSRDIDDTEYGENIEGGLEYLDRDESQELHCRLVNNSGGTASDFDVITKALVW